MQTPQLSLNDSLAFIDDQTRDIAMRYLEATGGPTSLGVYLCLKYRDDTSACSHEIDPRLYCSIEDFRPDYLGSMLLSKYKSGLKSQDQLRKDSAKAKFWACEERLASVPSNLKLLSRSNTAASQVLYLAQEKIRSILGPIDTKNFVNLCSFGPGSSSSVPRRKAHPSNKYLSADVTAAASTFVSWFFQDARFPRPTINVVESSRVEFVAKNFKSDRIIAVEPDWNIFFQKGVGKMIRQRLRRVGIDLDHASVHHGKLAREASVHGRLATIDLSSASDSIATALVRFLLPPDWFYLLNSLRTSFVEIDSVVSPVRKFSSMGNGFTFELESLVFYALASATRSISATRGPVSVFGDDIILPTGAVSLLLETFSLCGFLLNQQKSYWTSPFRESCGYHYFDGRDCKPLYLKKELTDDSEKFKFCNAIRRLTHRLHAVDVLDHAYRDPYALCARSIRRKFYIPDGYGDGGLISYFDEVTPATSRRGDKDVIKYSTGIEGYRVRCLQPGRSGRTVDHGGVLIHKLRTSFLRRKSIWHQGGTPLFRVTLSDLRRADYLPEAGNDFSFSQSNVKMRVGVMHIPRWFDPGEI